MTIRAIDTTGTIDERNRLILDQSVPLAKRGKVRVIILYPEHAEIDETEWLRTAATNPAFGFLNDPKEDVYTIKDGKPFQDEMTITTSIIQRELGLLPSRMQTRVDDKLRRLFEL